MIQNISQFFPILCVCFIEVYCNEWDPRVWPETFVEDGKPFIEFTCGAYLRSEEWLSWYNELDNKIFTTIEQQYDGYRTINLQWPLARLQNSKVYCAKENETYWKYSTKHWAKKTPSKSIPIEFKKNVKNPNIGVKTRPWVTPAAFVDHGKQVIEYTCYAYLNKRETLSWYQLKGKSVSKLGMIQQEANYGYVKITLQKTLEPSDNGSEIYCSKEGNKIQESERILIIFERHIEALEAPYVTVEPGSDVAFFDEGDTLEFVCSGSKPVDGRVLTWYLQTPFFYQVLPAGQHFYRPTNQNCLTLHMNVFNHGKLLYCAQDFTLRSDGTVTSLTSFGELARSRTITLLHRAQCNKKDHPRVIPEKVVNEHKPFIQFTCYAFLESGQLLSWYQSKGFNKSVDSLLRMIQLQDPKGGEWAVLTLNKTLEPSDNGSEIYCARQSVLPDGSFSVVFNETKRIPLRFQRDIPPLDSPFIRVEPKASTVYFDPNTTIRLTCRGSEPVDGRNYTWFIKDSESVLRVATDQKFDAATNLNVLDLPVNEYYQLELFCAQGFFSYIHHTDSLRVKMYGEVVVSNITTLIQREKQGNTPLILTVTIPLALFVLVAAGAACWLRRSRTARSAPAAPPPRAPVNRHNDDSYGEYANVSRVMPSPQVTYAVLELSNNAHNNARAPPAPQTALYAEIVDVYKQ